MNKRIEILASKTIKGEMWVDAIQTNFDRTDIFLSPLKMSSKHVCEYILNQEPLVLEESCFTGFLRFNASVIGDIFTREGHKNFQALSREFYNRPINNLLTFEWQHSVGDFGKIIDNGIVSILNDIEDSKFAHNSDDDALKFLDTQEEFCNTLIRWAEKCSIKAFEKANETKSEEYRDNLIKLSEGLKKVPLNPAKSFYEAVLSLYICYPFIPDSIGLIDRYLFPYFTNDIKNGNLTTDKAKEYLQELFLSLQSRISIKSDRFYRGGEAHFCIGGYLQNGEDGFNELSKLIVEALMELPTWIPQISFRWTKKTPSEILYYMMDCERKDPNKRIAFVNDEPRIKGLMKYSGYSYEEAVNYTMMGCNELALPGGIVFGFDPMNILRSIESLFYNRKGDILKVSNFEELYAIYEEELFKDLWEANKLGAAMQEVRSRDCNIVSNIFVEGCIERAKSLTQGGSTKYIAVGVLIGISNVIDSLSVTKQFVFDKKTISLEELVSALENNWEGYEALRNVILRTGNFFGNDDDCSNEIAQKFLDSLDKWNDGNNYLKKKWIFGNLIGYNEHNKFFGNATKATPDGRFSGDATNFGIGQSEGKDRKGLTALLNSVAKCDPNAILTGPSVTNVLLEKKLIEDDENFKKVVKLFETYFKMGGTHFQLNYISKDDLIAAQKEPEKYKNLRVRVSGFSDYFINLNKNLQDEITKRTDIHN